MSPEWFNNKKILDIGCNIGYVTIQIAKTYPIKSILGIDIDEKLISKARKVLNYHATCKRVNEIKEDIPLSIKLENPIPVSTNIHQNSTFPNNISFKREDFINDLHFGSNYDVILAYINYYYIVLVLLNGFN